MLYLLKNNKVYRNHIGNINMENLNKIPLKGNLENYLFDHKEVDNKKLDKKLSK